MKEARVMWDGRFRGKRVGGPLALQLDHLGDLKAHFGFELRDMPLAELQQIALSLAKALKIVEEDFSGRIIIAEPSRRVPPLQDPIDPPPPAGPHGSGS